jgi:hypothetical protein
LHSPELSDVAPELLVSVLTWEKFQPNTLSSATHQSGGTGGIRCWLDRVWGIQSLTCYLVGPLELESHLYTREGCNGSLSAYTHQCRRCTTSDQVTEPWFQWRCFWGLVGCARWSRPMWHRSCNSSMIIF